MPLNITKLQQDLLNFFSNNNRSAVDAATELSTIIDSYIRNATIIVTGTATAPPGSVITAGSPASQINTTPVVSQVTGQGTII